MKAPGDAQPRTGDVIKTEQDPESNLELDGKTDSKVAVGGIREGKQKNKAQARA